MAGLQGILFCGVLASADAQPPSAIIDDLLALRETESH